MDKKIKESIDNMSYMTMLGLWRNSPIGHAYFKGEVGVYFTKVFQEKKDALKEGEHTRASKLIGWS